MDCSGLRDDLLDVLYGEASPETQRRVDAHARECPACRTELGALRDVRSDLQAWKLPEMRPFLPQRPRFRMPLLLATAAALLLATGAAFALRGSELRYEEGRFSFRLGGGGGEAAEVQKALAAQDARHDAGDRRAQGASRPRKPAREPRPGATKPSCSAWPR